MSKLYIPFVTIAEMTQTARKYPKCVSPILNVINQCTHATRPRNVGQMTELAQEFFDTHTIITLDAWKKFYDSKMPGAAQRAAEKNAEEAAKFNISREDAIAWTEDLIYNKTFQGLLAQEAIGKQVALQENKKFRRSNRAEEAKGIDGWFEQEAVSIKPHTYRKTIASRFENIPVRMLWYKKNKTGFTVSY